MGSYMSYNVHYHVRPRYTAGSPAMIDRVLAIRLAAEESKAYQLAVTNICDPDHTRAFQQGNTWIVWTSWETMGTYWRKDMITGEMWSQKIRPHTPIEDPPLLPPGTMAPEPPTAMDTGPWEIYLVPRNDERGLLSDDRRGVKLCVDGAFADLDDKLRYLDWLCKALNVAAGLTPDGDSPAALPVEQKS